MDCGLHQPQQKHFCIVCEARDELIEIETYIFEMKIKQEIIVPPLWGFIFYWLELQLATIVEIA